MSINRTWNIDELIALKYITGARRGQFTPREILRTISHTVVKGGSLYDKVAAAIRNITAYKRGCDYEIVLNPSKDGPVFSSMALDSIYVMMVNGELIVEDVTQNPVNRLEFYSKESLLLAVPVIEGWLKTEPEKEFFQNFLDLILDTMVLKFRKKPNTYQEFVKWAKQKGYETLPKEEDFMLITKFEKYGK